VTIESERGGWTRPGAESPVVVDLLEKRTAPCPSVCLGKSKVGGLPEKKRRLEAVLGLEGGKDSRWRRPTKKKKGVFLRRRSDQGGGGVTNASGTEELGPRRIVVGIQAFLAIISRKKRCRLLWEEKGECHSKRPGMANQGRNNASKSRRRGKAWSDGP